jgi:hypothetical protein
MKTRNQAGVTIIDITPVAPPFLMSLKNFILLNKRAPKITFERPLLFLKIIQFSRLVKFKNHFDSADYLPDTSLAAWIITAATFCGCEI